MKTIKVYLGFALLFISANALSAQSHTQQSTLPCLDKTFSVVVHIAIDSLGDYGITTDEIEEKIEDMNAYFAPICAKFKVCEFRYIENYQYDDIIRTPLLYELSSVYHQANRINVFFATEIDIDPVIDVIGVSFGGIANLNSGGIALEKGVGVSTYAHEFGHYFGLPHTFVRSGTTELVDGSNCETTGDGICDTPADPYVVGSGIEYLDPDNQCRFFYKGLDANGEYYSPNVGNIMSYYGGCRCNFTHGQYVKMANSYLNSNPKMW